MERLFGARRLLMRLLYLTRLCSWRCIPSVYLWDHIGWRDNQRYRTRAFHWCSFLLIVKSRQMRICGLKKILKIIYWVLIPDLKPNSLRKRKAPFYAINKQRLLTSSTGFMSSARWFITIFGQVIYLLAFSNSFTAEHWTCRRKGTDPDNRHPNSC